MITDEQLAELEQLSNEATPGPWSVFASRLVRAAFDDVSMIIAETQAPRRKGVGPVRASKEEEANLQFITNARNALPELVAEIKRLQTELAKARCQGAEKMREQAAKKAAEVIKRRQQKSGNFNNDAQAAVDSILSLSLPENE